MNYLESKAYLESLAPTLTRPTLDRISRFMDLMPEQADVPCIHIGGTNGKGSTVAIADSVLRALGYKVGRFTGPHLLRWNERFHVDGKAISDEDFARLATRLRGMSEKFGKDYPDMGLLTWFEFLTVIAFMYFAECNVDLAVMEVGLGGRFDATTVRTNPWVTVITNVSLDHTHLLGDTVEKIAFEKAGIIEPGISVITACQGAALDEVLRVAEEKASLVYAVTAENEIELYAGSRKFRSASAEPVLKLLSDNLSLQGPHQLSNGLLALLATAECALASGGVDNCGAKHSGVEGDEEPRMPAGPEEFINTIEGFDVETLSAALRNVRWPGRLQYLPEGDLLLDGAHNPSGAQALRASLDQLQPQKRPLFVVSCFESKDAKRLLACLVRSGERVFVAEAQGRRSSHSKEHMLGWLSDLGAIAESFASIADAVDAARDRRDKDEFIVICGSFAAVKETMQHFGYASVEDSYLSNAEA